MKDTSKQPQTTSATLTTTNLESISDRAEFDKAQFIETYVRTQRTYRKSYEEEGRADWGKEGDEGVRKEQTLRVSERTGFGTPILKARAPEKIDASKERPPQRSPVLSGKKKDARKKAVKQNARGASGKGKESEDPERTELLAGRRERRRTKKAIIAPKDSGDEDMIKDSEDKPKKGQTATKTKKARKGDISAGLALMHGFSATNVGAMRLTMKPSLGVFTKGKASAKTGVPSKTTSAKSKSVPHIWTESQFLNKRKHASSRDKSKSPVRSEGSSVTSSAIELPRQKKRKREPSDVQSNTPPKKAGKIKICNYSKSSKRKKVTSPSSLKSTEADHESEPAEKESVIWDIESLVKEPTKESAEPEKDVSRLSSNSSRHNNTLIINVRATRWNGAPSSVATRTSDMVAHSKQPARCPPSNTEQEKGKDSVLDAQSSSSLCPSHSASQAMPLLSDPRSMQPPVSRSKYFKNTAPVSIPDDDNAEPLSLDYEDMGASADVRMHQAEFDEQDTPHHPDSVLTCDSPICAAADPPHAQDYLDTRPSSILQDDQDSLYSSSNLGDPHFLTATHSHIASPMTSDDPWNPPQDSAYYDYEADHYRSSWVEDEEFDDEVDNMVFQYSQESRLTDGLPEVITPTYDDTGYEEGYFYGSDYAMAYDEAMDCPKTDCDTYSNPYGYPDATLDDDDAGFPSSATACDEPLSLEEPDISGMESFLHGQAYLRGYSPADSVQDNPSAGLLRLPTLAQVEDGVARRLHGHWKPQKL
ncbi:hypothetical protein BC629DRAFT_1736611 [Irpex lacteus]|nr:hypothetical protein BC629DRAFT_1736611 [Irpex lacteus]